MTSALPLRTRTRRGGGGGQRSPIGLDYEYNRGNLLKPQHVLGPESDKESIIGREETEGKVSEGSGRGTLLAANHWRQRRRKQQIISIVRRKGGI